MKTIRQQRWLRLMILVLGALAFLALRPYLWPLSAGAQPPSSEAGPASTQAIEQAIQAAIEARGERLFLYKVYLARVDTVFFSDDNQSAAVWLAMADPVTGEVLASEPGLALVRWDGSAWLVTLQTDADWVETMQAMPDSALPSEAKAEWLERYTQQTLSPSAGPFGGYKLPWTAGEQKILTRSLAHDADQTTSHFAFDFSQSGVMFDVRAAKAGVVKSFDDHWENNHYEPSRWYEANYILLEDTTTTPTTYQLYLHLAQDSIPAGIKSVGAQVANGQLIGIADDTGWSTGHHLHFHVHTYAGSWWGTSEDITFSDVTINGGRPRNAGDLPYCRSSDVCDDTQSMYISGNVYLGDMTPPYGALTGLETGQIVESGILQLNGWGADDQSGLYSIQLRAYYNAAWHDIAPLIYTTTFNYDWDWCAAGVGDGLVSVAARLIDLGGNQSPLAGLAHLTKDNPCAPPPPECAPGDDQVALFSAVNYQGCTLFAVGDYSDAAALGALGGDNAASIRVGAAVKATAYRDEAFSGRRETFAVDDNTLVDNLIGIDSLSSLKVSLRDAAPELPLLKWPASGAEIADGDGLDLFWEDGGGALEYQVQISDGISSSLSAWQAGSVLWLPSPGEGSYTWQVRARSGSVESAWSAPINFEITAVATSQPTFDAPYTDDMETTQSRWLSTGLWRSVDDASLSRSTPHAWWYQGSDGDYATGATTRGDLTSPYIAIPASGHYYLRFYYRNETENNRLLWDQRWVQISADHGPFINLWQLSDDPAMRETSSWLASKALDLGAYAGQTIRVRFHFDSLDAAENDYRGWGIDDFSINTTAPASCTDSNEPNDDPTQAAPITIGQRLEGVICPNGDMDFYQFEGQAGQQIAVDIDAMSIGSSLDSYLYLLDSQGDKVLAEHDDEIYAIQKDSRLNFTLPYAGIYLLKVRDWKHPSNGGSAYNYWIGLYADLENPALTLIAPADQDWLHGSAPLSATVSDANSGVARVEFTWHTGEDWLVGSWENIGTDTNGADGWQVDFDTTEWSDQGGGGAVYVYAYDRAGNRSGAGAWNLAIDNSPPVSALAPLGAIQNANAFYLTWNGSDAGAGLAYYDLQWTDDDGASWTTLASPGPGESGRWVVVDPGDTYGYRMRAVDQAGNAEAYPSGAESETTVLDAATLCAAPDEWESDNSALSATAITTGTVTVHNFCNLLSTDWQDDEDWFVLEAQNGVRYAILATPGGAASAMQLSLYASDGTTLLLDAAAATFGEGTGLSWLAVEDGIVFVRVRHIDGRVIGAETSYHFIAGLPKKYYLPLIPMAP